MSLYRRSIKCSDTEHQTPAIKENAYKYRKKRQTNNRPYSLPQERESEYDRAQTNSDNHPSNPSVSRQSSIADYKL